MASAESPKTSRTPLTLDISHLRFEPVVASDHEGSSDEGEVSCGMAAEDLQSALGPSISRAQTRMMSPRTPAVEKSAAMAELAGEAFDGPWENKREISEDRVRDGVRASNGEQTQSRKVRSSSSRQDSSSSSSPSLTSTSTSCDPQVEPEREHAEALKGPTNALADLNVKRYLASFSVPRVPLFHKGISVPSLSSVLGGIKAQSPTRRGSAGKRASVLDRESATRTQDDAGQHDTQVFASTKEQDKQPYNRRRAQTHTTITIDDSPATLDTRAAPTSSTRPAYLRRATSDQSLFLRRSLSAAPSLGDDSRWENVQEQVNSRIKALKDSFQDSSIKLPSMPSMPSINFNPFKPEQTKSGNSSGPRVTANHDREHHSTFDATEPTGSDIRFADTRDDLRSRKELKQSLSHIENALEHLTGDVLVLGGYRGSILRSAKPPHRQLWVPVKVGLNIRKVNLEVGLDPTDEENMHESIYPSGMLSHIGPVDMGRRLLKRLNTCKNVHEGKLRVHDYGYDWRLSPGLLSRRLIEYLQKLPCNQHDVPADRRGAVVIAHSMGGLITRHAVNQRPELFAGVLYAGVPQHCVNILGPFRNGDDVLLSSRVLTAQVNFSMRSSFVLLPDDGVCFIDKETKEEYLVDFFDPQTWKTYAFSPCIAPVRPCLAPEKKSLLNSLSDSLPSLSNLPLPTRKSSPKQEHSSNTGSPLERNSSASSDDAVASNMSQEVNTTTTPTMDPTFLSGSRSSSRRTNTMLSSSGPTTVNIPFSSAMPYLTRTLRETLEFRQQLQHNPSHETKNLYPPHSIIYATNTPTVSRARVSSRAAIARADAYDDLQFGSGDGVVLARAAQLPAGYRAARGGRVKSDRGHVSLLGDMEAVGRCLMAILRERSKKRVGLGHAAQSEGHHQPSV